MLVLKKLIMIMNRISASMKEKQLDLKLFDETKTIYAAKLYSNYL